LSPWASRPQASAAGRLLGIPVEGTASPLMLGFAAIEILSALLRRLPS